MAMSKKITSKETVGDQGKDASGVMDQVREAMEGIGEEPRSPTVVRQNFVAYTRCMWSLLWTAFRHPFTTTVIDWSTGKVLSDEEAAELLRTTNG
jgi:hypothetical protein